MNKDALALIQFQVRMVLENFLPSNDIGHAAWDRNGCVRRSAALIHDTRYERVRGPNCEASAAFFGHFR
jgi:hypothetical protein